MIGQHTVRVALDGYRDNEQIVDLAAASTLQAEFVLNEYPQRSKREAGGVVGLGLVTSQNKELAETKLTWRESGHALKFRSGQTSDDLWLLYCNRDGEKGDNRLLNCSQVTRDCGAN